VGDAFTVPCGLSVVDRRLRHAARFAPGGCSRVKDRDQPKFVPVQLGTQEIAEQVVVAVPLTSSIERDEQEVGLLQRLEDVLRSARAQHRVAERARQAVEHRGARQERHCARCEAGEELGPQVVAEQAVVTAQRERRADHLPGVPRGHGSQIQADRPALGLLHEVAELGISDLHARTVEEQPRLSIIHRQLGDADLGNVAPRTQQCRRERRRAAGGDDQLRSGW
jgi:hypothetical protein